MTTSEFNHLILTSVVVGSNPGHANIRIHRRATVRGVTLAIKMNVKSNLYYNPIN